MAEIKVTIDLNFQFKGPDGKPLRSNGVDLKPANELVGNFLFNGFSPEKADKLRNRTWAHDLYKSGTLEVDKRGIDAILSVCSNAGMADGVYGELEEYLEKKKEEWTTLKEEAKKKEPAPEA